MTNEVASSVFDLISDWAAFCPEESDFQEQYSSVQHHLQVPHLSGTGSELPTLERFLQNAAPIRAEEIRRFCEREAQQNPAEGPSRANKRRSIWLDDRQRKPQGTDFEFREYQNPLDAVTALSKLSEPRYGEAQNGVSDADKRLIYVRGLDSDCVYTLAIAAVPHEIGTLQNALWKHVKGEPSISAKILDYTDGVSIFELEFSLPYYTLLQNPTDSVQPGHLKQAQDVSFLQRVPENEPPISVWTLYEGQITVALCGPGETRFTGFAFEELVCKEDEIQLDPQNLLYVTPGFHADPFAGDDNEKVDANKSSPRARQYFLNILDSRSKEVFRAWEGCVVRLRNIIEESKTFTIKSTEVCADGKASNDQARRIKEGHEWTTKTSETLQAIRRTLKRSNLQFDSFNRSGQMNCLLEMCRASGTKDKLLFAAVQKTFGDMKALESELDSLMETCRELHTTLASRLSISANEAAWRNGSSAEYTIVIITPFLLTMAYFSMQQQPFHFETTVTNFILTTLIMMGLVMFSFDIATRSPKWWIAAMSYANGIFTGCLSWLTDRRYYTPHWPRWQTWWPRTRPEGPEERDPV